MEARDRLHATELIREEARAGLRERAGVADVLDENRVLATALAGIIAGSLPACGLLLGGESIEWSLIAGGSIALVVFGLFLLASRRLGRPVVPALWIGRSEPGQLLEGQTWESEAEAAREARRRNLTGRREGYWIEVELEPGTWAIERRGARAARGQGDFAVGDYGGSDDGGGGGGWGDGGGGGGDGGG